MTKHKTKPAAITPVNGFKGMKFYFGYGMNTNIAQMAGRCPAAVPQGTLILEDHRLVFRGVADVEEHKGSEVWGALWLISERCERALDQLEGYPRFYTKAYIDFKHKGKLCRAMMYVMTQREWESPPGASYEQCLREGYASFKMPAEQIDTAIKRAMKARPPAWQVGGPTHAHKPAPVKYDYSWIKRYRNDDEAGVDDSIIPADAYTDDPTPSLWDDDLADLGLGKTNRKGGK